MRRTIIIAVSLLGLAPGVQAQQPAPTAHPFEPVGRWQFHHTDGTPFIARLAADQTAETDWEGGEHGIWRWEGAAVRMIYTDGWDDLVRLEADGHYSKRGWEPQADRCGPASNETKAEHISADPGKPLH